MPIKHHKIVVDRKKKDKKGTHYSPKQKTEAVTMWLMTGNLVLTAAALNISEYTLREWKTRDWWKETESEIRSQTNVELSGRLRTIINKSMSVIEDRLENGDFQYNPKTGQFVRRPVGAKTATDIMAKGFDKKILIDKLEERPQVDQQRIEDRLKVIQEKMLEMSRYSKSKLIEGEIIEDHLERNQESVQEVVREGRDESSGHS